MHKKTSNILANKNLPNYITTVRIAGTASLLFVKPLSTAFLIIYTIAGITDALDGFIARKMGTISEFGSKLDSIADLLLYGVMIIKLFPILWVKLPHKIWFVVGSVILLRVCSYIYAGKKYHRFSAQHTYMNKVSGLLAFGVPYMAITTATAPYCWVLGGVSMIASIEEIAIHIVSETYDSDRKSIFSKSA